MLNRFPFALNSGVLSHKGMVRAHNEDSVLSMPEIGLWVVADGMGGHEAGDVASQMIVEAEASVGQPTSASDLRARFLDRLTLAHERIREYSRNHGGSTVGSTVVGLLCSEGHFACIWAGDSRVYLLRERKLVQLTTDHTEAQELLGRGILTAEQALTWPRRNVITRAIGVFEKPHPDQVTGVIQPGDTYLLCSDGLTEHISDDEIAYHMQNVDPQVCCEALVNLTLARGARDNVSVIVVRCGAAPSTAVDDDLEDPDKTKPGFTLVRDLHHRNGQDHDGS
jgi:protein phosphatase